MILDHSLGIIYHCNDIQVWVNWRCASYVACSLLCIDLKKECISLEKEPRVIRQSAGALCLDLIGKQTPRDSHVMYIGGNAKIFGSFPRSKDSLCLLLCFQ